MHESAPIEGTMYCRRCWHILERLPECRCPECGVPFNLADPDTYRTESHVRWRIRRAARWTVVPGVLLALWIGWVFLIPSLNPECGPVSVVRSMVMPTGAVGMALELYRDINGDYPPTLLVLMRPGERTIGPYLSTPEALFDPWGNRLRYIRLGRGRARFKYRLWSTGRDGVDGTQDDVVN